MDARQTRRSDSRGVGSTRGVAATMRIPQRHSSSHMEGPAVKWVLQVRSLGPGHPEGAGSHSIGRRRRRIRLITLVPQGRAARPWFLGGCFRPGARVVRIRLIWSRDVLLEYVHLGDGQNGWGGGAGRTTTTSGDDHADHDAGQQRTAIGHHEPVPRSVPRPPIVQFPLRLSPQCLSYRSAAVGCTAPPKRTLQRISHFRVPGLMSVSGHVGQFTLWCRFTHSCTESHPKGFRPGHTSPA